VVTDFGGKRAAFIFMVQEKVVLITEERPELGLVTAVGDCGIKK
jgi:hypothetical protein